MKQRKQKVYQEKERGMMRRKRMNKKGLITVAMLLGVLIMPISVNAKTKAVAQKTITVKLNQKTSSKIYVVKAKKGSNVKVSMKIISKKGKVKQATVNPCCCYQTTGQFPLFGVQKPSAYKKGKKFNSIRTVGEWSALEFWLPEGVKSATYKITVKTTNKKKNILSVKRETSENVDTYIKNALNNQ